MTKCTLALSPLLFYSQSEQSAYFVALNKTALIWPEWWSSDISGVCKELQGRFSVGSVMIGTIRSHHFRVPKCLDMQDKYEQNCTSSFLGWRIFSFLESMSKFPLWRSVYLREPPQMLLACGSECLQQLKVSLLRWHPHLCPGRTFWVPISTVSQFRYPSAASVSGHMIRTMPMFTMFSACVWPSSQLQNLLFHHSDTY